MKIHYGLVIGAKGVTVVISMEFDATSTWQVKKMFFVVKKQSISLELLMILLFEKLNFNT